MHGATVKKKLP